MAHKKAGGSSRNGRDSAGRRLGVKNSVAKSSFQETSSCVSAVLRCGQAMVLAWAKITQSLRLCQATSNSTKVSKVEHSFLFFRSRRPLNKPKP